MKITNKLGLPEAYVLAVQNDSYSKQGADFSVTELIKPPRIRSLEIAHKDELTEDVSDRFWSILGQLGHLVLERANRAGLAEKRFFANVSVEGKDYVVSGQLDSLELDNGILSDYKFTTVWGFMADKEPKDDWVYQLNMQRYLLNKNGLDAKSLRIVGGLRDWQISAAAKNKKYPQAPVAIQNIPIWSLEKTEEYIKERIKLHIEALTVLPECSGEDTWGWKRCASYCLPSEKCTQYQQFKKDKKGVKL